MKFYRKRKRCGQRFRRGAAAVEFALIAPVFFLVIFYCAEFARLSLIRNLAQNAAYEAARFVMTDGATVNEGIAKANQILGRLGTSGAIITINGEDGSTDGDGDVIGEIDFLTMSVRCSIEIPLSANSVIVPDYIFGDAKIRTAITVRTERYRGYYDGVSTN